MDTIQNSCCWPSLPPVDQPQTCCKPEFKTLTKRSLGLLRRQDLQPLQLQLLHVVLLLVHLALQLLPLLLQTSGLRLFFLFLLDLRRGQRLRCLDQSPKRPRPPDQHRGDPGRTKWPSTHPHTHTHLDVRLNWPSIIQKRNPGCITTLRSSYCITT